MPRKRKRDADQSIKVGSIEKAKNIGIGTEIEIVNQEIAFSSYKVIEETFVPIIEEISKIEDEQQRKDAMLAVDGLKEEAKRGEDANEDRVRRWLEFLLAISYDAFEVAVSTFIHPLVGISTVFRKVSEKAKEELGK
jgi:hypothetical protein